jgi:hypothetical protein
MSPPTFQRVVYFVLGWPGLVLWLCGFASLLLSTVFAFIDFWPDGLVSMVLSAVTASIGFIIFTAARLLTTDETLRIPARHLPAMIGFQLAAMISGAIAIASLLVTSGMVIFGDGDPSAPWTAVTSVTICAALLRYHTALKEKWKPQTGEERLLADGRPASADPAEHPDGGFS